MAKFIVGPGQEFNYPANDKTVKIIAMVGGRSKLNEEQLASCSFKTVREGEDCSDMPPNALDLYLSRGMVIEVGAEPVAVAEVEDPTPPAEPEGDGE